jgi:tripartite-type tricarboxylate transporter receptor subunit TctC
MRRRWLGSGVLAAATLSAAARLARAQPAADTVAFPSRPIRMVVPFAPGGAADVVARLLANGMAEDLGQPVVVENRGGSGGVIGSEAVLAAPADGYTIVFHTLSSAVLNAALYRNLRFDLRRAFAPVSLVGTVPNIVLVNPRVPAATLAELIALLRANPGRFTYASSGPGTIIHLSGHMLGAMAGAQIVHVPYRGSGPAMNDLIAGTVDLMVDSMPSVLPFIRAGSLRALAMGTRTRNPVLPEIPTADEAGLPGYESYNWYGVFAAAATPPPVLARLERAVRGPVRTPALRGRLAELGMDPTGSTATELEAFREAQFETWIPMVRASGATAD